MALDLGSMNLEERTKYLKLKAEYGKGASPWYKKWWGISIILIFGLFLILATAAGFYVWSQIQVYNSGASQTEQTNTTKAIEKTINPGTGYFLGTDNAILTIVEFSDFACPYCEQAYPIVKKIAARYPGQVKIIFRNLPLHENSVDLAMGAYCAGEQGKFWDMHDQLFANQSSLKVTGDSLKTVIYSLAGTIGLNAATFDNCYTNKKYLPNISADYADAETLKLKGTPSWFINNRLLSGYIPENDFLSLLDKYIASLK
jgi:protein-disulfide isomerase